MREISCQRSELSQYIRNFHNLVPWAAIKKQPWNQQNSRHDMKATATIAFFVASSAALFAQDYATPPLQSVPKNLARQHYGSNLFVFDTNTQRYVATEAAAAWLDDDLST